ncbi:MAG TPA: hypothetical protein DCF65_11535 [Chloroflexi bacterium]|nr:hypothetical protein [Chloroflexota bacterium]HAF19260.1 hypothetical protein [Chloroflexota bacterium]
MRDETSAKNVAAVQAGPAAVASPPPQGAELAYLVASTKNEAVLRSIDDLDRKIAVAIAALGVAAAAVISAQLPRVLEIVLCGWLIVGVVQGLRAFVYDDQYQDAPKARTYAGYAEQKMGPEEMRWRALPVLLDAIDFNKSKHHLKGQRLNHLVFTLAVVAVVALAGRLVESL